MEVKSHVIDTVRDSMGSLMGKNNQTIAFKFAEFNPIINLSLSIPRIPNDKLAQNPFKRTLSLKNIFFNLVLLICCCLSTTC